MHSGREPTRGFTLLEVILVLLLLGIMASAIVYTMPERDDGVALQNTTRALQLDIEHAREQALLRNWVIGMIVQPDYYEFVRWHQRQWQPIELRELRPRDVGNGIRLEHIEQDYGLLDNQQDGDSRSLWQADEDDRDDETLTPQIIFFESTDFVPFVVTISNEFGQRLALDGRDGVQLIWRDDDVVF